MNEEILKETLGIYFDFLTNRPSSVLIREVFMSLPSFATHVNVEIVWDLL